MSDSNGLDNILKKVKLKDGRTVVLRYLQHPDIRGIWENFNDVVAEKIYLPVYTPVSSEWEREEWYKDLLAKKNVCVVADDITQPIGRQIVGQLTLENLEWEAAGHVCQLGIIVRVDYRNQGLGFQLISTAKHVAKSRKKSKIILSTLASNVHGITLYQKCGFSKAGQYSRQYFVNEQFIDEILMEVHLDR